MATFEDRFPENAPGEFFVDDGCIACSKCDEIAPTSFKTSEDGDHNFVYRQPESLEEREAAEEALEECPVEAIGRVGGE